jgi:hypothetical protein
MLDDGLVIPPRVMEQHQEELLIQADQVQQGDMQLATPSEDQIRAADRVFTQEQNTDDGLSAILGVTTGILILHDMAVDRLTVHEDEEEPPKPKDKPDED